jgi:hypothetical protein
MKRLSVLLTLFILLFTPLAVRANTYSRILSFGDDFSDNGQADDFGFIHYSNGLIWAEYLATGMSVPLFDMAYGGATTGWDNPAVKLEDPVHYVDNTLGLQWQVNKYLTGLSPIVPSNTLVTVWAGANDYLQGRSPAVAASNVVLAIQTLADHGGQNFLVPNLYDIGFTPALIAQGPIAQAAARLWCQQFNGNLAADLLTLKSNPAYATVNLYTLDTYSLLNAIIANPAAYGFTNVTQNGNYSPPPGYLFWDATHLTTHAHFLLAQEAWVVLPTTPNHPPIANAGTGQTLHVGNLVTLDGSASSDQDGDYPLTYSWQFVSRPAGSGAVLSGPNTVNPSFTPDKAGGYTIQLIVTDSKGASSSPSLVTVSTLNTAPIAEAGNDQPIIKKGYPIQLNGTQSYDPDGDPITYSWSILVKPAGSTASLSNANSPTPTITPDVYGTYSIQLKVMDSWGAVGTDTVTLSINNLKPVANAGQNQSLTLGDTALLDGSASSDPNGDPLSYTWSLSSVPVGSTASIANTSAVQTSFIPDLSGTYVVSLKVNDGLLDSDPSNITITVVVTPSVVTDILQEAIDTVNSWDPNVFKNKNMANALTNKFNTVIQMVIQGKYADAIDALQYDILQKTDGCVKQGFPDKNDWITNCQDQQELYWIIINLINALKKL